METDGHNSVCGVESLLHTITVVTVDVDIQNSSVIPEYIDVDQHARDRFQVNIPQKLQDTQNDICRCDRKVGCFRSPDRMAALTANAPLT